MQKFLICAGGVKVLSAKLAMGNLLVERFTSMPSVSVRGSRDTITRLCCEHGTG